MLIGNPSATMQDNTGASRPDLPVAILQIRPERGGVDRKNAVYSGPTWDVMQNSMRRRPRGCWDSERSRPLPALECTPTSSTAVVLLAGQWQNEREGGCWGYRSLTYSTCSILSRERQTGSGLGQAAAAAGTTVGDGGILVLRQLRLDVRVHRRGGEWQGMRLVCAPLPFILYFAIGDSLARKRGGEKG